MTHLLDANVLIALVVAEHEHHDRVSGWAADETLRFAVSPVIEGALVRFLVRVGESAGTAKAVLDSVHDLGRVTFLADDISYRHTSLSTVHGHRQVTDAYLAGLARHHGTLVATLDRGLAEAHPDVADLLG